MPAWVTCPDPITVYPNYPTLTPPARDAWVPTIRQNCFVDSGGTINYGIYTYAIQLVVGASAMAKVFYGLFFGVMTLR